MSKEPNVDEIEASIIALLRDEEVGTLATLDAAGAPACATMHFAGDGLGVYMHTFKYTRKYQNILRDPRVSYSIYSIPPGGFESRFQLKALQISGRARLVNDPAETEHAIAVSKEQFLWLKEMPLFDALKDADESVRQVFFRIDPIAGMWQDNAVRMMWWQTLTFSADGGRLSEVTPYNRRL